MADPETCPVCAHATVSRGEGRLDQCGNTYLPTVTWSCATCGWVRFEPALGRQWRPAQRGAVAAPPAHA